MRLEFTPELHSFPRALPTGRTMAARAATLDEVRSVAHASHVSRANMSRKGLAPCRFRPKRREVLLPDHRERHRAVASQLWFADGAVAAPSYYRQNQGTSRGCASGAWWPQRLTIRVGFAQPLRHWGARS